MEGITSPTKMRPKSVRVFIFNDFLMNDLEHRLKNENNRSHYASETQQLSYMIKNNIKS